MDKAFYPLSKAVDEGDAKVAYSKLKEFPNFDVGQRSAASIARRLQDPLSELVTPNIPEAQILSGMNISGAEDMERAGEEGFQKDRQTKEVEAESCAYVLMKALLGLDSKDYSFSYIASDEMAKPPSICAPLKQSLQQST